MIFKSITDSWGIGSKKIIAECDCSHPEHRVEFAWFKKTHKFSDIPYIYISVGMADLPWYKRLYYGIQYIFKNSRKFYGYYEETSIAHEDLKVLITLLQEAEKDLAECIPHEEVKIGENNGKESNKEGAKEGNKAEEDCKESSQGKEDSKKVS